MGSGTGPLPGPSPWSGGSRPRTLRGPQLPRGVFLPGHQEGVESGPPVDLMQGLGLQRPPLGSGLKPVPIVSSWHWPWDLTLLLNVLAPLPPVVKTHPS